MTCEITENNKNRIAEAPEENKYKIKYLKNQIMVARMGNASVTLL